MYKFTYNERDKFSHSQLAICFDLPNQNDVNGFKKVSVLKAPPGVQNEAFDETKSKQDYVAEGWTEQKIGTAPERSKTLPGQVQA